MQNEESFRIDIQIKESQIKSLNRNSSFELLRIFAMIFIIMSHFCWHGVLCSGKCDSDNNFVHHCSSYFGTLGNYLFMLISGYFLSSSKFSYRKIVRICGQMTFYSIPTAIFLYCLGFLPAKEVFFSFIPYFRDLNWYACAYIVFYFFVPYLNKLLSTLDQKEVFKVTIICVVFNCVIPKIPYVEMFKPDLLLQFFMMYFTANYIKRYKPLILDDKRKLIIIFFISVIVIEFILFLNDFDGLSHNFVYKIIKFFFFLRYIAVYILAVTIFCIFLSIHFSSQIVNFFASGTFGIYLFHDNNYIRPVLWHSILKTEMCAESRFILPYMCLCVFMIFIIGTIIDAFRRFIFKFILLQNDKKKTVKKLNNPTTSSF
ncbi:MAG: acyltransferase [Treponema sp.]|nr:acyltransferase [Treponema sp.]